MRRPYGRPMSSGGREGAGPGSGPHGGVNETRRDGDKKTSAIVWCGGAGATQSCQGTYAATSLQPLPQRVVVDLDIHDRSQRNLMLADRFLRGVHEAGLAVGQDANVLLHANTSRLEETSSGATRGAEQTHSELGGLAGGGMRPKLPPMPATGMSASRFAPTPQPLADPHQAM
jgi:hypothetical protein